MDLKEAGKKTVRLGKAFIDGIREGLDNLSKVKEEAKTIVPGDKDEIVLTASHISKFKWMSPAQLKAIYGGKKVRLDNDPKTLDEMKWMSPNQLEAIFGRKEDR